MIPGAPSQGQGGHSLLKHVCLVLMSVVAVAGHGGSNLKEGDTCVPWQCSCFYRGVYYDDGDVWADEDDPCVTFKCTGNGFFTPIKSGCSFKGTCHDRGSSWTEGCFRYTCPSDLNIVGYRLQEAACVWKDGNCYAVGERAVEHCDIYECQIDGGCYVMNKIKSGCKSNDPDHVCKPMFSFWQDECSLYQCVGEEQDSLKARILTHTHDVMMWPRGHYALPEPKAKCPNLEKKIWMEGTYRHCGDGCNFKSQEFDLLGTYNEKRFEHNFCIHHDVDDPELIPLYQTYWGEGRYCILRYNGTCPEDFSEGFLLMVNQPCNMTNGTANEATSSDNEAFNTTDGRLPDGNFTEVEAAMEFCCRYDGDVNRPIILPAKHPFVLFMAENETECQAVQGMHFEKEFWSFCDVFDGQFRIMNGSLPLIKTGDNNTLVNFCYYTPIGCGCTDDDETMYAIGENATTNCITKECRNIEKQNVMVVIQGGCYDDLHLKCRDENETWTDTEGEMCVTRQCVRETVEDDHLNVTFKIIETEKACRDGDHCVPLNYTKEKGCYASQCQLDEFGKASLVLIRAGCSIGNDVCIPDGANHTQGCITLGCEKTKSTCGLHVVKGGCGNPGGESCTDVDGEYQHGCSSWVCREVKEGKYLKWKLLPLEPGCADNNGNCYKEGDTLNTSCATYECIYGDRPGFYPVWSGCGATLGKDKICINPNDTLKHGCNTYRCTVYNNGTKKIHVDKRGCSVHDKCYDEGDVYEDTASCSKYRCDASGYMRPLEKKCSFNSTCYPANEDFKIGCNTYRCNVNTTARWVSHIQLACKVDDKCIDPGVVYKRNCHTYKCSEDKKSCASHLIEYGCHDDKTGACVDAGGDVHKGCSLYVCKPNGTSNPYEFKSGDCPYNDTCIKVGETKDVGDCNSLKCDYRTQGDATSGLALYRQNGCVENGECKPHGSLKMDTSSDYFCSVKQCHNGQFYSNGKKKCKDINNNCIDMNEEPTKYTLMYSGKECSAECSTKGISGIRC